MKNKIIGILLLPFLYVRYASILFVAIACITNNSNWAIIGFVYVLIFVFVMGNLELLDLWASFFIRIFGIKYTIESGNKRMHSHCISCDYSIMVNNKRHDISIATSGGNLYDSLANIKRKAIFYYLFNN